MKAVVASFVDLILATATPNLIEKIAGEVEQRTLCRIERAVAPVALDMDTKRGRVGFEIDLGNFETAGRALAIKASRKFAVLVTWSNEDVFFRRSEAVLRRRSSRRY